jgi:LmbE family N-acetylglucosaminyl deacetylase
MSAQIWPTSQKILVILAHPDDPEFFCGASIAQWVKEGHHVSYCLLTKGEKGVNQNFNPGNDIVKVRMHEQANAGKVLGVENIIYLDYEDGYLEPSMKLRKDIIRVIRSKKPSIIVSCDPTNYYMRDIYINHPDHRAAGQAVIDAVFPASQNPLFFPELLKENLLPHIINEVWLSLPKEPNIKLDVTEIWGKKISALLCHQSQIGENEKFLKRMAERKTEDSSMKNPRFEETFHRIVFRNQ